MNKKLITLVLTAVFIIVAFFVGAQLLSTTPENGEYLHYRTNYLGGAETKAFLLNSQLSYGVYKENIMIPAHCTEGSMWCTANAGDPCVIINGTIRNHYCEDYWFVTTADVYNSKGETIGPILTSHAFKPGITVTHADSGAKAFFEIQIKYDAKDIVSYNLFLGSQPNEIPPP